MTYTEKVESGGKSIDLKISLGGGWIADLAQVHGAFSPIALVTFTRGHDHKHVRVDLNKRIFLDEAPDGLRQHASEDIAERVVTQLGW